jgi:peptidyl-tRNA hydrolase
VHAAGESSPGNLPAGTYAIVLACAALEALSAKLKEAGVSHHLIVENDGLFAGEATALGVVPGRRSILKKHFSSYPLLR